MKSLINRILSQFSLEIRRKTPSSKSGYNYWEDQKYLEKSEFKYVLWLYETYKKISRTPGHIVELGVAYGRNSILFGHLMRMNNEQDIRRYFGFDTFDGYTPETLEQDTHLSENAWRSISVDAVQARIDTAGPFNNVNLVQGDLLKTLPEFLEKKPNFRAAMLYIDCNAYEPALEGMRLLKDFMSPGGIICIDEKNQGGETKALIEFCQENNLSFQKDDSPFAIPAYVKMPN